MVKLVLRQEAINDLTAIWDYTTNVWSENQADKYYQEIKAACLQIAQNSKIGKTYQELDDKLLVYRVGRHFIIYKVKGEDEVEVIRILHESMDLRNRLS